MVFVGYEIDECMALSGKTHRCLKSIVDSGDGLFLFAVDRIEVIAERRITVESLARSATQRLMVIEIHSAANLHATAQQSVRTALEAAARIYTSGHVIAFITHESLKSACLDDFNDWHLVIDETMSIWDRGQLRSKLSTSTLDDLFALEEAEGGSRITPRRRWGRQAYELDTLVAPLATLYARSSTSSSVVMTSLRSWDEAATAPSWSWYSLWSPQQLSAFASTTILAADYTGSVKPTWQRRRQADTIPA